MKNEKNYIGFRIPKIWQILKRFAKIIASSINLLFLKSVQCLLIFETDINFKNYVHIDQEKIYIQSLTRTET